MSKKGEVKYDVLILCGGLGTRFQKVTNDIPKALATVKNIPFINFLLDDLISQGFKRIILATGHLGDQLEEYVKIRSDAEIIISHESKTLGTGGAIKLAENHFFSKQILVLNGDSRIIFKFTKLFKFHNKNNAEMSVLLSSVTKGTDFGNVLINDRNRITAFFEKPHENNFPCVNAGAYVINLSLIKSLKPNKQYSLEKYCLPLWINSHSIFGLITEKPVFDIGTPERYKNIQTISFEK